MEKLIELRDVSIRLNDRVLYDHLNFDINRGDKYMLVGENGCGKSLLLELIALGCTRDLTARYKGLKVEGQIIDSNGNDLLDPNNTRNIAYITQQEKFRKHATVKGTIDSALKGVGLNVNSSALNQEMDELLSTFGILDKKHSFVNNSLSFGEGKVVHIISRIMQLNAVDTIFMDEPLNHLSFTNSKKFNDIICETSDRMKAQGRELTIVMISHCRAVSFPSQIIEYNCAIKGMEKREYHFYDCFGRSKRD